MTCHIVASDVIHLMMANQAAIDYGKCSKFLTTFLFLFLTKMLCFKAGIHKIHVKIRNREDPDQTASSEAV